jgi:hypothetical protein
MNIFYTDHDSFLAAMYLDDIRANKMIVESAQMLSTTLRYYHAPCDTIYKTSFINHPCTVWVRQSRQHYLWLVEHGLALCSRKPNHKTASLYYHEFQDYKHIIPDNGWTEPPQCNPFKSLGLSTVESYRMTMNRKWDNDKIKVSWTTGYKPNWKK